MPSADVDSIISCPTSLLLKAVAPVYGSTTPTLSMMTFWLLRCGMMAAALFTACVLWTSHREWLAVSLVWLSLLMLLVQGSVGPCLIKVYSLAFGSLPQHFHLEPTSARQGCRGLAQKLYHHSGNKTLLMLVSQLTEDSLHIRNVFRNEDIKLIQENIAFWRKIKQLPVIHPIVVTRVKHLVNKPRVNITCDVECVSFDCCWVVEISWPWATPIESKECFSINGWAYML